MIIKIKLIIFSLMLSIATISISAEEFTKEENRYFAIEMSKCYGAQEAKTELLESIGKVKTAEQSRGVSRGTKMAAMILFHQAGC